MPRRSPTFFGEERTAGPNHRTGRLRFPATLEMRDPQIPATQEGQTVWIQPSFTASKRT
jgi:hypothetical protein